MEKIKVLIVDDSAFMRKILTDILTRDHRIEVIGTARNGQDALKRVKEWKPDVVTMDVEMPQMDGLEALQMIMNQTPVPVVMVSSLTKQGAESTIRAMTLGAVDFIQKPSGPISLDMEKVEDQVVKKVLVASRARISKSKEIANDPPVIKLAKRKASLTQTPVVAIGTSTGGPRALDRVVTNLPKTLRAPVVIVQHMPKGFTRSLAERLNKQAAVLVKEAVHGELLQNGCVYIAPGGEHMTVVRREGELFIQLDETEPIFGHRPSVNRLFSSLAHVDDISVLSVVMTGMGADGTEGLVTLKEKKPHTYTIAEAEESCVVFGMPKAVIKSGLADEITPVSEISQRLVQVLGN
ncbi:chemotaxis response regulator protein-glutamate methylesterase [Halobacillus locisalis]|uniref:Protein-glutamate methylesterase/protein-glutamine glutaminase n=1 Tax=Halobacillus locisalis TaxID=220753 RepID=A0A838CPN6_9BACI|nr:chemotaxis response regulator protein-glutamate methylesterase [Halobacillus locisalis]MBA2174092.1 chemotaxis response regulator protein-glutamate methylesterase [Halobacillus locisalis]